MFIGDSVWDAEACRRAGVASIGVLSGGVSREDLTAGGARVVFEDTRELTEHIADTPIAELL